MISRRMVLRGLGTAMALPYLESLTAVRSFASLLGPASPPIRMAFLFVPNGIDMSGWTPASGPGPLAELPPILNPLEPYRGSLNILTGLSQYNANALQDGAGDHARSAAAWLTGVHPTKTAGAGIHAGISADQVAAQHLGKATRFASLELGCEFSALAGDCDSGYSCAYSGNISWRSDTTPNGKEVNPRLAFERLFGTGDESEKAESVIKRTRYRQSILDMVSEEAGRINSHLDATDRRKLDEYFSSVREIEQRMAYAPGAKIDLPPNFHPTGVPSSFAEHIRLMGDIMVLAFQTDQTRICTFMLANEGSNRGYAEAGVPEGHHDMSHHGNLPEKLAKKRKIDTFHATQVAYIAERLQSVKEGDGTLLDHSIIVYGGGISDGNAHNHNNLPIVLLGRAGGSLKGGQHRVYPNETPLNNLYLSMLDKVSVPIETLGNSTGKLATLF
jgi:hypothetical protein